MKHAANIKNHALGLLLLLSCGCGGLTGYGPSAPPAGTLILTSAREITPRTKGGTLTITPQSKGGTLLGNIVWPTEVKALSSRRFDLKLYYENVLISQGQTDSEARFSLVDVPAAGELRIEASVPGHPFVTLRRLVDLAELGQTPGAQEVSMLSTAATAIVLDARGSSQAWAQIAPQRLLATDLAPLVEPLAKVMTPYLDAELKGPIEKQEPVLQAISQARQAIEPSLKTAAP